MAVISFAWTTPALLAGHKTVTRRDWKESHARRFRAGDVLAAFNRQPRYGGRQVASIRLTQAPYLESTALAPEEDYEAEGLAWLAERGFTVDGQTPLYLWAAWKRFKPTDLWVVRFKLLGLT